MIERLRDRRTKDPHRKAISKETDMQAMDHGDDDLPHRLLDITTLAKYLGVNTRHVRRLVAERRIPFIKWGHLIRFDPVEVSEWGDAYRRRPERAG